MRQPGFDDKNVGTGKTVRRQPASRSAAPTRATTPSTPRRRPRPTSRPGPLTVTATGATRSTTAPRLRPWHVLPDDRSAATSSPDSYGDAPLRHQERRHRQGRDRAGISISRRRRRQLHRQHRPQRPRPTSPPLALTGSVTGANKVYDGTTAPSRPHRRLSVVTGPTTSPDAAARPASPTRTSAPARPSPSPARA